MVRRIIGIARGEWTKMTRQRLFYILLALAVVLPFLFPLLHGFREGLAVFEGSSGTALSGQVAFFRAVSFSLGILIPVLLIYAGMNTTSETEHSTLKTMLVRPVRRTEFLLGKLLMLWLFTVIVLAVMFAAVLAMSGIFFDWPELFVGMELDAANIAEKTAIFHHRTAVMFPLVILAVLAFVTVAFSISTIARGSGTSVGIIMMFFVLGALVVSLEFDDSTALSALLLNAHCSNPLAWVLDAAESLFNRSVHGMNYFFAVVVPAAYIVFFTTVSGIIFSRRRITT